MSVFLKPLKVIIFVYILGSIGLASDIMQLTNFNILDFIMSHAPSSYLFIFLATLLLYFLLIILEFWKEKKQLELSTTTEVDRGALTQSITTGNVQNSTISQTGRDSK